MLRVVLVLVAVALTIYTLLDIGRTPHQQTRVLPKVLWFVVALLPVLGPLAWLAAGRPRRGQPASPTAPRRPRRRGPTAPDDDPEFLRRLGDQTWSRRMQEERRAREADSRGRDPQQPPPAVPPAADPDGPAPG